MLEYLLDFMFVHGKIFSISWEKKDLKIQIFKFFIHNDGCSYLPGYHSAFLKTPQ